MFYDFKNDFSGQGGPDYLVRKCKHCKGTCTKAGRQPGGRQKYRCKSCKKYQQISYTYNACRSFINTMIIGLNRECCGIRSISRLLAISKTTILRRIKQLAGNICKPLIINRKNYEVDELRTYIGNKNNECWICLAVEKQSGKIMDVAVGRRSKNMLGKVISTLLAFKACKIFTDGLNIYRTLVPVARHIVKPYLINKAERRNLDLRNSMKRLVRKGLGFSKDQEMLEASLRLCIWC